MSSIMKQPKSTAAFLRTSPQLRALSASLQEQERLLPLIRSLLPEPLRDHCLYVCSSERGLIIYTESSAWASRLRYASNDLRLKLRAQGLRFGKINVRILLSERPRPHLPRCANALSASNAELVRSVAEDIQDPDLSLALERLSRHVRR
jgi:hypothetical protein